MPKEVLEIEIRAKDNISAVAKKIQKQLENLRVSASKERVGKFESALRAGVSPELLPEVLGGNQLKRLKALESLRRKYTKDTAIAVRELNKAFREGDQEKIKAMANAVRQYSNALRYLNRSYGYYTKQIARSAIEDRQISRFQRMRNRLDQLRATFRKAAADFVWASLSMLGVSWSLQAVLDSTVGQIRMNAEALADYSNAAFSVATWLAIAGRQGVDFAKLIGTEDVSKYTQEMTENSLLLKATFGSLREVMMVFFNEVLERTPGLKERIVEVFNKLLEVLGNERVIKAAGDFINGLLTGIETLLDKLPDVVSWFDKLFTIIMDSMAKLGVAIGEALGIPAMKEVSQEILNAESGFEKFGVAVGSLAVVMPVLQPLLSFFQSFFSILQGVIFMVYILLKGLGGIGGLFGGGKGKITIPLGVKADAGLRSKVISKLTPIWEKLKSKVFMVIMTGALSGFKTFIGILKNDPEAMTKLRGFIETIFTSLKNSPKIISSLAELIRKAFVAALTGGFAGAKTRAIGYIETAGMGLLSQLGRIPAFFPFSPIARTAYDLARDLGVLPRNVNQNIYVNIGNVSSDMDVDRVVYTIGRGISYQVVR